MPASEAAKKAYLKYLIDNGICVSCATDAARVPSRRCEECLKTQRKAQSKKVKSRRARGLCRDCDRPAEPDKVRCEKHLKTATKYRAKSALKHPRPKKRPLNPVPLEQRCGSCRKRERRPNRSICQVCTDARREQERKKTRAARWARLRASRENQVPLLLTGAAT